MSLEVRGITFEYKNSGRKVFDGFSASFEYGTITALTGNNGAGKTTLARIIMGILKPRSGDILLDGERINEYTLAERGRKIGYVMQNPAKQIFSETVEEEIRYGLKNIGLSETEIDYRTDYYLEYFGIERHRKDFPFTLSHGEKQRLVLAAILAMKPEYLILDEPTASLDFKRREALAKLLCQLKCGIIVISHDRKFIEKCCNRVIRLELPDE